MEELVLFDLDEECSCEETEFSVTGCLKSNFLIGCYRKNDKNQLDWILNSESGKVLYNIRADKRRNGWVSILNPKHLRPDFIVLYEYGNEKYGKMYFFTLLDSCVRTESEMRDLHYPDPAGSYIVYTMKTEVQFRNFPLQEILKAYHEKEAWIPGKPIFLNGKELMKMISERKNVKRKSTKQQKELFTQEKVVLNRDEVVSRINHHIEYPEDAYTSIDLFSGCGGMTKGFSMAGVKSVFASDIDENCEKTFTLNFPDTPFIRRDITAITKEEVDALLNGHVPDIIIGGPPCQGFSLANKRRNTVSDDPRNKLFYGFVKFINWYSPKAFVMENVKGLLSMQKGEVLNTILDAFSNAGEFGYNVEYRILKASDFGVPQNRERVILIGFRRDLDIHPLFPQPYTAENPVTVDEAISDLPQIESGQGEDVMEYLHPAMNPYQSMMRSRSQYVMNHISMKHTPRLISRFEAIGPGQSLVDVWETHGSVKRGAPNEKSTVKFGQNNQRLWGNMPAPTIAASFQSNFIHPHLNRNFTAREGARLQSFPDDFIFEGMRTKMSWEKGLSQYQQIGNAVPVLLAKAIAESIITQLNNYHHER